MWCCGGGGQGDHKTSQTGKTRETRRPQIAVPDQTSWKELEKVCVYTNIHGMLHMLIVQFGHVTSCDLV